MPFLNLDDSIAAAAPAVTLGPLANSGKTLAQLRFDLDRSLGNRTDVTPAELDTWINDAYLLIASGIKFKETAGSFSFNTVAGQPFYKLPSAVVTIGQASLADATDYPVYGGAPLEKIDEQIYRQLPDLTGVPQGYFMFKQMLVVWPTPLDIHAIAVEATLRPAKMVADTDSPVLPPEWHRGLSLKAKAFAYEDLEEFDKSEPSQNSYVRFLREIGDPTADEEAGKFTSIRPVRKLADLRRSRRWNLEPGEGCI